MNDAEFAARMKTVAAVVATNHASRLQVLATAADESNRQEAWHAADQATRYARHLTHAARRAQSDLPPT